MGCFTRAWEEKKLQDYMDLIDKLDAAQLALQDPTVQVYHLDTGQSVQRVNRQDMDRIVEQRAQLWELASTLSMRLYGCHVMQARPAVR